MSHSKPVLIADIGGGTLKIGLSTCATPRVMDNCIMKAKGVRNRVFIGEEVEECSNLSGLYCFLPFKKGYVNNWELQKQILDNAIGKSLKNESCKVTDVNIIVTEPYFNFSSTKETMNEIFFEEYGVKGLIRTNPAFLSHYKDHKEKNTEASRYALVIDSGYSFTHLVPYKDGKIMKEYVKRISIGGKILTNRLIEITSYRQLDVRNEGYVVNQCKEDVSFVSTQFWKDMEIAKLKDARNTIVCEYILPDFASTRRGYIRSSGVGAAPSRSGDQYVLRLTNERFAVPELLFVPGDVGYPEMGLSEALVHTVLSMPLALQPRLLGNVLLTGGNAQMPGFRERLLMDVRALVPDDFAVHVETPDNPQLTAWQGGQVLANSPLDMKRYLVTKKEYEECGHSLCEERFPV